MRSMKTSMVGAGLILGLVMIGTTGARAQSLKVLVFSGTIHLPVEARWEGRTVPAGDYSLYYGTQVGGVHYVEIDGKTEAFSPLFVKPQAYNPSSSERDELVCARDGNRLVVLGLQMATIGESLSFARSSGIGLAAQNSGVSNTGQIGAAEAQTQRLAVTAQRK